MSIYLKNIKQKIVYTVFLEPAICDWAWVKEADDETTYVGSCVTNGKYWGGEYPISDVLQEMVDEWINNFICCINFERFSCGFETDLGIDWEAFNTEGMAIAKQLKVEMSDDVEVRYVKANGDPTYSLGEGFEVLNDGSILPKKRLLRSAI